MKTKLGLMVSISVLCASVLFSGCGNKEEKVSSGPAASSTEKMTESTAEVPEETCEETQGETSEEIRDEVQADANGKTSDDSIDDVLAGTYVYKPGDEQEERAFEISCIAGKYYVEYMGYYDYAGAELQINNEEKENDCIKYDASVYAFSGFSFMGEYWDSGKDIQMKRFADGSIVLGEGQPFLDGKELALERRDGIYLHEAQSRLQENKNCPDVIGSWRCVSERDGELHEIAMIFSEDGSFRAVNKVKNQPPAIYLGNYSVDTADNGDIGSIDIERFAYGSMPDSWVLGYDQDENRPYVYSDYMYAEPFTYKEGDELKLPFVKIDDSEKSSIAPGPGGNEADLPVRKNRVEVSNTLEFLNAIADNTEIVLKEGIYNLTADVSIEGEEQLVDWERNHDNVVLSMNLSDGFAVEIYCVDALSVVAAPGASVSIVTEPRNVNVLMFSSCSDIYMSGITMGHTPDKGTCDGGVLEFDYCENIRLRQMDLYGCGTYGIVYNEVDSLELTDSIIRDCSTGMIYGSKGKDFTFTACDMVDCSGPVMIWMNTTDALFDNCSFTGSSMRKGFLPENSLENNLIFKGCLFGASEAESIKMLDYTDNGSVWFYNCLEDIA